MAEQRQGDSIVVIGASAGGIDALSTLVTTIPANLPAPIVVAQHLDPRRPSRLNDLLSRRSTVPIRTVEDRAALEPGVVYLVPENSDVEIADHQVMVRRDGQRTPLPSIDLLFTTAAASYGENTIAVILTGTGTDGAAGARDVKASGGTIVVQNPETASFPGMPLSLAPSIVDIVANLESIGALIGDLLSGTYPISRPDEDLHLHGLLEQLRERSGIDFNAYKAPTITRRLQRRMAATGASSLSDYMRYLQRNPDEYQRLINSFLIKVTEFFRDPELFEYLREQVLPAVVEEGRERGELRLWSAGCATGEEAYSLAILMAEQLGDELDSFNARIFATDLDADAVGFARRGIYPSTALATLPPEMVERYFTRTDGAYEVRKSVRSLVVFGQHDLGQRAPFPRIDVTLCRNVLIYFTADLQKRALQLVAFSLRDQGYLILGKAETVSPLPEYFSLEQPRLKVYRRVGERVLIPTARIRDSVPTLPIRVTPPRIHGADGAALRLRREQAAATPSAERAEAILLRMPVGVVVVNQRHDIQMINVAARRLLGIHSEAIGEDLIRLVQYVPLLPLRNAIDDAFRGEPATLSFSVDALQTATGDALDLELRCYPEPPRSTGSTSATVTLIVFDVSAFESERRSLDGEASLLRGEVQRMTVQVQQLSEANHALVTANDELATINADLRNANEELLVANEEVQSATEEVETLNEELQATNEELETLNEELQATVEELNTTNDDLQARSIELQDVAIALEEQRRQVEAERDRIQAILDNMSDAVLVVDAQGQPILSNGAFQEMFGTDGVSFKPEDVAGHPLDESRSLQQRVATGEAFTTEFQVTETDGTRHWYEASAQPIENAAGERLGVVVVRDITDRSLRRLQDEFLALASHELRTPLTSLMGSLQLLQRRISGSVDEQANRQLEVARRQADHLTTLIHDLVDIVRLQTGRLQLHREPVDLVEVVRDASDAAQGITERQSIEPDLPDSPVIAEVDGNRLAQVLMNLLNNAIIYAPETDLIQIRLRQDGDVAEIRVHDDGPGVPAEDRERIFARFSQIEPAGSERQQSDGLGLGLFIAREIVTAHGGTLAVEETAEPGVTFIVRVPLTTGEPS
ncbi:MAG TPA: CheR family methyltransferase [Thermomicrobiales bacterium]|nr:CheR family methyltransferase [Thermomicrobiales bacterium]